tara:strand:+ start:215 stop:544 length:330 start_codon:yes stop_codon:yes gene_type:complete
MSNYNDDKEDYDPMTEIKNREMDEQLLADAFNNSYRLLTREISVEEILDENLEKKFFQAVLAFDPELGPALNELESMIDFYIIEEEYEKCANIRDIMHIKFPNSINIEY